MDRVHAAMRRSFGFAAAGGGCRRARHRPEKRDFMSLMFAGRPRCTDTSAACVRHYGLATPTRCLRRPRADLQHVPEGAWI